MLSLIICVAVDVYGLTGCQSGPCTEEWYREPAGRGTKMLAADSYNIYIEDIDGISLKAFEYLDSWKGWSLTGIDASEYEATAKIGV